MTMGPIGDNHLEMAQSSKLGVPLAGNSSAVVSAIGQSDDICLVSNDIYSLWYLLQLSYCQKHHVTLSSGKTKLQTFSNKATDDQAFYDSLISPMEIDEEPITQTMLALKPPSSIH